MFALVWFWKTRETAIIDCDQISESNDRKRGALIDIFFNNEKQMAKVVDVSGKLKKIRFTRYI